jgi:hypothetical protein
MTQRIAARPGRGNSALAISGQVPARPGTPARAIGPASDNSKIQAAPHRAWALLRWPGYGVLTGNEEQTLAGWLPVILQMAAVM